jgi:phospholipid/cholesterol/gamma-HCH transport system substrate-binding protein
VARRTAPWLLAVALIAVAVAVLSGGSSGHRLRAVFVAALQARSGQQVRIAGRAIGSIDSVALSNGQALVTIDLGAGGWPLHQGTTAELRFGAAAAYASRFVQLTPGPATAPTLPDGALLPVANTITPVEFDQVFSTFGPRTRANFGGTISGMARVLSGHGSDIASGLSLGSAGIERTANVLGDLGADPAALSTLLTAGARTASALRARDPQLQGLVTSAAETLGVFADNATAMQETLDKLPATLATERATLAHLDRSLGGLSGLVSDIRPGAVGLRRVAPVLAHTLHTLVRVAPLAIGTLRAGTRNAPAVTSFLSAARPFTPPLSRALASLAPMVGCIRPYAPEIAGFQSTWAGIGSYFDKTGHFVRVNIVQTPVTPGTTETSAQAVASSGGSLSYAMPRPPGLNAGRPWFQPQCGAGPGALDPSTDPEAGR